MELMTNIQTFSDYDIDIGNKTSGQHYTICPKCSHDRKKKSDKCLSVNITDGVWNCHHCGWSGVLKSSNGNGQHFENKTTLSDFWIDWFLKRNISQDVVNRMRITCGDEWMPQVNSKASVIKFPYFNDDQLINTKYRDAEKNFKLTKGAPLILYNLDGIKDHSEAIIVEGEMDALSLIQCGIKNVVSVPNGANPKNNNLSYIDNCRDELKHITRFNILTDFDEPGEKLAHDLARKLGPEKCFRVTLAAGCKDPNEALCKHGRIDFFEERALTDIPQTGHKPSLEILLNAPRTKTKSLLRFCNSHLLRARRIGTLIAPAGAGKTSGTEALVASHLNNHVDTFKLEVVANADRPLLLVDLERTQDEILESCDRIARRICAENNPELLTAERFKNVFIHGFLQYPGPEEKLHELERLVKLHEPYLVLLDGAASFVLDVNDTRECVYVVNRLLSMADAEDLSFFCTVHPNPGQQNDFKPRGVFGSELIRQSESVLLLKRAPDDRDTRILTTSFMHGKNRSGADNLETYFRWSDTEKMFVSCDYARQSKPTKEMEQMTALESLLAARPMGYSELVRGLVDGGYCAERTAKRWIDSGKERSIIFQEDGMYKLTPF
jgi:5S rRNA maturation endonuclease (ribonuclease M5)